MLLHVTRRSADKAKNKIFQFSSRCLHIVIVIGTFFLLKDFICTAAYFTMKMTATCHIVWKLVALTT